MLLKAFRTAKNHPISVCLSWLHIRRHFSVSSSAAKDGELRVFLVAGEVSGDAIGSRLMDSLKKLSPFPVRFSGVGGSMMCKEARNIGEGSSKSPVHFHYVAPSFWAWKGGEARLKGLTKFVDHVFCILPNEAAVCQLNGLAATFVGHPVLEDLLELNSGKQEWRIQGNPDNFRSRFGISKDAKVISLLPGSRLQEVTRMLPIFTEAIDELQHSFSNLVTVIHVAPNQDVEDFLGGAVSKWPAPAVLVPGGDSILKYDAFSASKVALCTSGTVAVELQLARLPCAVAYRANILTEWFVRYKAKIQYISLPNILMDSPVVPESLFRSCTPTNLAAILAELLRNEKGEQEEQIAAAEKVIRLLFPPVGILETSDVAERNVPHCSPSMIAASTILSHVN